MPLPDKQLIFWHQPRQIPISDSRLDLFFKTGEKTGLALPNRENVKWWHVGVYSDGTFHDFLVPHSTASRLRLYGLLSISGRWIRWRNKSLLIATQVTTFEYLPPEDEVLAGGAPSRHRLCRLPKNLKCFACKEVIEPSDSWGINEGLRIECTACSVERGKIPPIDYLRRGRLLKKHQQES